MIGRFWTPLALAVVFVARPATARAVCLYPDRDLSGYKIPLELETRTSPIIVIGRVTSELALRADASDPEGISGYIYEFKVSRTLKGRIPGVIELKTKNDSGGYRMSFG